MGKTKVYYIEYGESEFKEHDQIKCALCGDLIIMEWEWYIEREDGECFHFHADCIQQEASGLKDFFENFGRSKSYLLWGL